MIPIDINKSCYNTDMIYPGEMMKFPYVLHGDELYPIKVEGLDLEKAMIEISGSEVLPLPKFLESIGAAAIQERIGILAFGANRNPENMAWKLGRYRDGKNMPVSKTIIVLPGGVTGADVVAANIFYGGHFFADLLFSHELTRNTTVQASIQLVDKKQLEAIHISEEVPSKENITEEYWGAGVASLPGVFVDMGGRRLVNTLVYVSSTSIFVSPVTNQPIAFRQVEAEGRTIMDATQEEMYEHLKKNKRITEFVDVIDFRHKLSEFWKNMKNGVRDAQIEATYKKLCKFIIESGLKGEDGKTRTGISEAKRRGFLLNPEETWNMPEKYYYGSMFEK